jgi:hypothetical protein
MGGADYGELWEAGGYSRFLNLRHKGKLWTIKQQNITKRNARQ